MLVLFQAWSLVADHEVRVKGCRVLSWSVLTESFQVYITCASYLIQGTLRRVLASACGLKASI